MRLNLARWIAAGLLSAGLATPLVGCSKEPSYSPDPQGVDRQARPQIVIKRNDVYLDGKLIKIHQTTAAEAKALTGYDPSDQASADAFWHATGIVIFAAPYDDLPGRPSLIHSVRVWFRQDSDSSVRLPCSPAQQKLHDASVQMSLESIEKDERQHNFPRDEEARARLLQEECTWAGVKPRQTFQGYLEVDGMPIGPNMTVREVQARRKQLGLLPLRVHQASGSPYYIAPADAKQPWSLQTWEFEWPENQEVKADDLRIKVISVP